MINYGYFRHRFDAHKNRKLNALADEMGIEAYACYYLLLELYGSVIASSGVNDSALIHQRVIANTWRKRVDSAHSVLTKLQLSGLLVFTKLDTTYEISIPNFLKYYGSYQKTDRQDVANKRKENKSKEKESICIEQTDVESITPDGVVQIWNNVLAAKLGYSHGLGVGEHLKNFFEARQFLNTSEKWTSYFEKISSFSFLLGDNPKAWKVTLQWAVNYDNALKVLDGQYDKTTSAQKSLRAWFDEEVTNDTQRA